MNTWCCGDTQVNNIFSPENDTFWSDKFQLCAFNRTSLSHVDLSVNFFEIARNNNTDSFWKAPLRNINRTPANSYLEIKGRETNMKRIYFMQKRLVSHTLLNVSFCRGLFISWKRHFFIYHGKSQVTRYDYNKFYNCVRTYTWISGL